jgi:hypothetical protein
MASDNQLERLPSGEEEGDSEEEYYDELEVHYSDI